WAKLLKVPRMIPDPVFCTTINCVPDAGAKLSVIFTFFSIAVKPLELTGTSAPVMYVTLMSPAHKRGVERATNATAVTTIGPRSRQCGKVLRFGFIVSQCMRMYFILTRP